MKKCMYISVVLILTLIIGIADTSTADIMEIIAVGRGVDEKEALSNAAEETLRQQMGALFLSREELTDDVLREKVILASRGNIRNTEVLEKKQEDGLFILTVKFQIDPDDIREAARRINEGVGGGVGVKKRPFLDRGRKAIRAFFDRVDLLRLLDVALEKAATDMDKSLLNLSVRLSLNEGLFEDEFARPLAAILDGVTSPRTLEEELADAEESVRHAATFCILDSNMSFRGWNLPQDFLEAFRHGMRLPALGKTILRTQKRVWLHIALFNRQGREIMRLPIPFPITNILLFSLRGGGPVNPWAFINKPQAPVSVIYAPLFGIASDRGYTYLPGLFSESFELHLPRETLSQIHDIKLWLHIE